MLYLILFTYRAPLEQLDRILPAHRAHLQAHYESGHFLMSGPFSPRVRCVGSPQLASTETPAARSCPFEGCTRTACSIRCRRRT